MLRCTENSIWALSNSLNKGAENFLKIVNFFLHRIITIKYIYSKFTSCLLPELSNLQIPFKS